MNSLARHSAPALLVAGLMLTPPPAAHAFPPAPHHVIEGVVRDAFGNPLTSTAARIILETPSGAQLPGDVDPNQGEGLNYRVTIPMDAGLTADSYRPTALQPLVPFKLKVRIGTVTYLPLEMTANYANLGQPAQRTRLDLTLGEDADGDGLPDAWERALMQVLGGDRSLADIRPGDDVDGDGLTNLQEYLAGTYAYDPEAGIALELVQTDGVAATLEFTVVSGRTYRLFAGDDVHSWEPVAFTVTGPDAGPALEYHATEVKLLRVSVPSPGGAQSAGRFFKLQVR